MRLPFVWIKTKVLFNLRSFSIYIQLHYNNKFWRKIWRSSFKKNRGCLPFEKSRGLFHNKSWGCLRFLYWGRLPSICKNEGRFPFERKVRSSSIWKKIKVPFHLGNRGRLTFWNFSGSGWVRVGATGTGIKFCAAEVIIGLIELESESGLTSCQPTFCDDNSPETAWWWGLYPKLAVFIVGIFCLLDFLMLFKT